MSFLDNICYGNMKLKVIKFYENKNEVVRRNGVYV